MQEEIMEKERRGESAYHTRAVSRALQILGCFSAKDFELSVGDLHEKLGVHKAPRRATSPKPWPRRDSSSRSPNRQVPPGDQDV